MGYYVKVPRIIVIATALSDCHALSCTLRPKANKKSMLHLTI